MPETIGLTDIQPLRTRARQRIQSGAVTPRYGADRSKVEQLLNEAFAAENACVLRRAPGCQRIAIDSDGRNDPVRRDRDSTTRRMLEEVLAADE